MTRYLRILSAVVSISGLALALPAGAQAPGGAAAAPPAAISGSPSGMPAATSAPPSPAPPAAPATSAQAPGPAAAAATSPSSQAKPRRYLVYFNEFSAYLSPRSKEIIAKAAKDAKAGGAKSITVQARASATGTVQTNKYLAMTRASIVADQLEADGIQSSIVQQEPIGQTGSSDPSVFNRRVDIILHR